MSLMDRAAQFSPFSALTGQDAAIKETDAKIGMDDALDFDTGVNMGEVSSNDQ